MAKTRNRVELLGNIGQDPQVKTTAGGMLIAEVSLATTERRKVNGEYQEFPEWHRITFFGKLAEIVRDYVRKGSKLDVTGHLKTEQWEDNGATRYRTKIIGEDVILLSGKAASSGGPAIFAGSFDSYATQPVTDEDIPF